MSQNEPLPHNTILRLPKIKHGLREGWNYDQIAEYCGLKNSVTIDRDMKAWVQSGQFEIWLKTEFVELHEHARIANPLDAYKEISKIVGKMVTRRTEVKQDIDIQEKQEVRINFDAMSTEEREIYRNLFRKHYLQPSKRRSNSIH